MYAALASAQQTKSTCQGRSLFICTLPLAPENVLHIVVASAARRRPMGHPRTMLHQNAYACYRHMFH